MNEVKKSNIFGEPLIGILMNTMDSHVDKRVGKRQRYLGGSNYSREKDQWESCELEWWPILGERYDVLSDGEQKRKALNELTDRITESLGVNCEDSA